jgi:hypothetical protein
MKNIIFAVLLVSGQEATSVSIATVTGLTWVKIYEQKSGLATYYLCTWRIGACHPAERNFGVRQRGRSIRGGSITFFLLGRCGEHRLREVPVLHWRACSTGHSTWMGNHPHDRMRVTVRVSNVNRGAGACYVVRDAGSARYGAGAIPAPATKQVVDVSGIPKQT